MKDTIVTRHFYCPVCDRSYARPMFSKIKVKDTERECDRCRKRRYSAEGPEYEPVDRTPQGE